MLGSSAGAIDPNCRPVPKRQAPERLLLRDPKLPLQRLLEDVAELAVGRSEAKPP
jgi:hypothetical protein